MRQAQNDNMFRALVLIPNFNDWEPLAVVLEQLDVALARCDAEVNVLIVDDASTQAARAALPVLDHIKDVSVLPLRRNLGHQRAIALGLAYVEQNIACDAVLVMDGDGEDGPADVPRLIDAMRTSQDVVFAERTRRAEGALFRTLYLAYRGMHWLLTGRGVRIGNFSILPRAALHRLVAVSELWNHYAGAVLRARIPYRTLPTYRRKRIAGKSHMSFVSLVTHGLSAMSVQLDVIGVRLLVANALCWLGMALSLTCVLAVKLFTNLAIPGWASTISMLLAILMTQSASLALGFVFMTLQSRMSHGFLPLRDYVYYVGTPSPWHAPVQSEEAISA
ncbi:MAG TPA: glycosyltransferase [Polyangiales bacterium]|nr:glycosyltransferase [Polyangiales bacterium]